MAPSAASVATARGHPDAWRSLPIDTMLVRSSYAPTMIRDQALT